MSGLLNLAADYIERMANPVFGISTNEDYAIKFGKLLESEGFGTQLRKEVEALKDPDALSSHGWLWLFEWAKSTNTNLDPSLLQQLFHEWASPFARAEIIRLATRNYEGETRFDIRRGIINFPEPFLAHIMSDVTTSPEGDDAERQSLRSTRAQSVLVTFLQTGSPIALDAASALLQHEWQGQPALLNFFRVLLENLDAETQEVWRSDIRAVGRMGI
jgi:hypothetical protein